jgi:hypothetical protein
MDITYMSMAKGVMYLNVITDVNSRYVLSWDISNTREAVWVQRYCGTSNLSARDAGDFQYRLGQSVYE